MSEFLPKPEESLDPQSGKDSRIVLRTLVGLADNRYERSLASCIPVVAVVAAAAAVVVVVVGVVAAAAFAGAGYPLGLADYCLVLPENRTFVFPIQNASSRKRLN